ncbi:3-methyl-2-oxobutanoate hydroxymethyltransferase [Vannielia litorea]|uniref:3-methyl-2-oxobutanoate hydroxymethyltransferase n=1 Tax=Vannielia litorea TaxID=1217970 RepID=UPI001C96D605|nr:3-methyl-2-oxobutanoate hydroxymethyltransferase [Vannielia litorea]MBY6046221.1 3-methyl-2-oxobutanoate hydroxymethyltransferase [Vannielia litorea]MBY6073634.1 3-methyl-2-oxobutanoate hydroxymethyltransferase [Vannielia litorea]MBY6153892.1 3-methyl-2-oxobutanoate hydroxymethyltransferase [Vannielia litorea]
MYHNRPHVEDIRAMKARGEKISMLYVTTLEEAAAADAAGIHMLSIEGKYWSPEMREAAGSCFVQVGLPYGDKGTVNGQHLVTAEDYIRAAYTFGAMGGDCYYCAASFDIQKAMCDNHIPIVAHVGLIPSYITWTGWRAVGKEADEALRIWRQVQRLEEIGCFGAELEVVPDRLGAWLSANTSMIMLGMGAGPGADAQYLFTEDVLGHGANKKPRHGKQYRNFKAEFDRLQQERIAAFREFIADVNSGAYPAPEHVVPMKDDAFETFLKQAEG